MNYIAKANICIHCDKDIALGTVFDPAECGMDQCMIHNLVRADLICPTNKSLNWRKSKNRKQKENN